MVVVTHSDGTTTHLSSNDYAKYMAKEGDQFDYSQFIDVVNPRKIDRYFRLFVSFVHDPGVDVVILTARGNTTGIKRYLEISGIPLSKITLIGTGDNQFGSKADVIRGLISDTFYPDIQFYDDCELNTSTVDAVRNTGSRLTVHLVPKHFYSTGI